jgi:hypothetical protein
MTFSKKFPRDVQGSNYPVWEEIKLTPEEEKDIEQKCRVENFQLMEECLGDAQTLAIKSRVNNDENVVRLAISLFEKRASHEIYWKERKAKEKFEQRKN